MKKLFTIAAAVVIASAAFAQPTGLKIGGGFNVDTYNYTPSDEDIDPRAADGYHFFVTYPFVFTDVSALTVGLRWQQCFYFVGAGQSKEDPIYFKSDYSRGYISLPVKYEAHFGGFFFNVGPTATFWALYNEVRSTKDTKTTSDMFQKNDGFNRFELGAGAEIGYDWTHIRVSAGYDYGITKGIKAANAPLNFNRHAIRLSVAYIF